MSETNIKRVVAREYQAFLGGPKDHIGIGYWEEGKPFITMSPEDMLDFILWINDPNNIRNVLWRWHADEDIARVLKERFNIDYENLGIIVEEAK